MTRGSGNSKVRGNWMEEILTPIFLNLPQCDIIKIEAPFKIVGYSRGSRQKQAFGYPEAKGGCDYEGGFHGIHCVIEAKRFDGKSGRWNFKSNIKPHQIERMRWATDFNEIAAIILCWDNPTDFGSAPQRWFWIPYGVLRADRAKGVKSWTLDDLERLTSCGVREMRWNAVGADLAALLALAAGESIKSLYEAYRASGGK